MTVDTTKRCYYVLLNDEYIGQTWAVSEAKAKNNIWWKLVKENDQFKSVNIRPSDFEAYCIN